ncbi:MAG: YdeI/OmpD-associated family protein [Chitinophagaceae bacterium]
MAKRLINSAVDFYFDKAGKWQAEIGLLRIIALDCGLTETLKWGVPCYSLPISAPGQPIKAANIVLIHVFKEYCAVLFFKGALLNNDNGMLVQQTEHVQSARQVRFINTRQIVELKPALKACIYEAIEAEKAGLKVAFKKTAAFTMPEEFKLELDKKPALKTAFEALTPGRQRGYLLHFAAPRQSKTRASRVSASMPRILQGKGLNDK